jgi:Uma2 family endonuclease
MTSSTATKTRATPDDLERMPDGEARWELVDGEIRERSVSAESNYIAANFNAELYIHVRAGNLGWVFTEGCGIEVFPEPNPLRLSDGAFVAAGRLPGDRPPARGYLKVAPDLVLEVLSPNDNASEIRQKVVDYLAVGVRLVWVAYPDTCVVDAFSIDGSVRTYGPLSVLDGGDVLPGFSVPVASLFPAPVAA